MKRSRFSALAAPLALSLTALLLAGCAEDVDLGPGEVTLEMDHLVGTKAFALSTAFATAAGDDFKVSTFKYYVSNLRFNKADNTSYTAPDSYFLVDAATPASQSIEVKGVPAGDYTSLSFVVGVDSARTKAGNYTGALQSSQGMWWDWSKEFINLKLEGTSGQSPKGGLIFHIAGYQGANGANNTIRTVTLPFPGTTKLLVRSDHSPEIHLNVDLLGMFGAPNPVRFATVYNTMGGKESVRVADNIAAGMFRVDHIHAN